MELDNKTIVISGASSGIGAAAARLFLQEGANVVLGAMNKDRLDALVEEVDPARRRTLVVPGDVTDIGYANELVTRAEERFGSLDRAFNNAGVVSDMVPVTEMTHANWSTVITVNLTSAFLAAQAQIPALMRCGGGSLVFTSSFVGLSNGGMPGMAAYAASKAGMLRLVQSLASEHAVDAIRVNALLLGGTVTPAGGEGNIDAMAFIAGLHPVKRMARPTEIAQAAMFMLSDRASFITGSPMQVDGSMSVRLV